MFKIAKHHCTGWYGRVALLYISNAFRSVFIETTPSLVSAKYVRDVRADVDMPL